MSDIRARVEALEVLIFSIGKALIDTNPKVERKILDNLAALQGAAKDIGEDADSIAIAKMADEFSNFCSD